MIRPTLREAQDLAASGDYRMIPVSRELYADGHTPIGVLRRLKAVSSHCYMLESAERDKRWGRYTFLGYAPILELTCQDGRIRVRRGGETTEETGAPGDAVRRILAAHKSPRLPFLPPFAGGLVGYFAYEYIRYAEPSLRLDAPDEEQFRDMDLMLFDKVIAFDHYRQKIVLIAHARADALPESYRLAQEELEAMAQLLRTGAPAAIPRPVLKTPPVPLFSREEYAAMVEKAKGYIREGDIFQVVLSNRLTADMEGSLFDVYRVLRASNPSPYMFYFSSDDLEAAGASPETLVKVEDGRVTPFPLAGTRPRGETDEADRALEAALLADEKELAEHNMLVDLGRNDIGKIAALGSVRVDKYLSVERFSHVMHLGSTVSGRLEEGRDAVDAVGAVLPAGTLSGAPKIRACEIIRELENNKRGLYGGAIGYLDFTGNLDTCIAIRLAFRKNGRVFVRSGAGIVADSVPDKEYQECLNKARAVLDALETAQGGLDA